MFLIFATTSYPYPIQIGEAWKKLGTIHDKASLENWEKMLPQDPGWRKRFLFSVSIPTFLVLTDKQQESLFELVSVESIRLWFEREGIPTPLESFLPAAAGSKAYHQYERLKHAYLIRLLKDIQQKYEAAAASEFIPDLGLWEGPEMEKVVGFYSEDLAWDLTRGLPAQLKYFQEERMKSRVISMASDLFHPNGTQTFRSLYRRANPIFIFQDIDNFLSLAYALENYLEDSERHSPAEEQLRARLLLFAARSFDLASSKIEVLDEALNVWIDGLAKEPPEKVFERFEKRYPSFKSVMDSTPVPPDAVDHPLALLGAEDRERFRLGISRFAYQVWGELSPRDRLALSSALQASTLIRLVAPGGSPDDSPEGDLYKHFKEKVAVKGLAVFTYLLGQIQKREFGSGSDLEERSLLRDIRSKLSALKIPLPEHLVDLMGDDLMTSFKELDQMANDTVSPPLGLRPPLWPLRSLEELGPRLLEARGERGMAAAKKYLDGEMSGDNFFPSTHEPKQVNWSPLESLGTEAITDISVESLDDSTFGGVWDRANRTLRLFVPHRTPELLKIAAAPWAVGWDTWRDLDVAAMLLSREFNGGPGGWLLFPSESIDTLRLVALDEPLDPKWFEKYEDPIGLYASLMASLENDFPGQVAQLDPKGILSRSGGKPLTLRNLWFEKILLPSKPSQRIESAFKLSSLTKQYPSCQWYLEKIMGTDLVAQ